MEMLTKREPNNRIEHYVVPATGPTRLMRDVRQMVLKKAAGYILLALSCLAWAAIFALPLFEISVGQVAALTTGLIIAGEATFFLGIALLGREAWEKIKAIFRKAKS